MLTGGSKNQAVMAQAEAATANYLMQSDVAP